MYNMRSNVNTDVYCGYLQSKEQSVNGPNDTSTVHSGCVMHPHPMPPHPTAMPKPGTMSQENYLERHTPVSERTLHHGNKVQEPMCQLWTIENVKFTKRLGS